MSSDEGESGPYEEDLFADEAEVSGSDNGRSGGERSGEDRTGVQSGSGEDKKDPNKDKPVKPKVKRPTARRILLNEDVLCGKNGLMKIEEVFKDFKFDGRGREKQDLDRLLHKIELWVHVLHPRNPFEQALERIEWLGQKRKTVKTHVKKIRMGLISNIEPVDDNNMPDFGNSDDEGNMESTGVQADDDLDTPARPVEIQHFGFDSEDEDDLIFANMVDPSMPEPESDTLRKNEPSNGKTTNSEADEKIEDMNMDTDDNELNAAGIQSQSSYSGTKSESDAETGDEGRLLIDAENPGKSVSNISEEIEDMMLDEESQTISNNEAVKVTEGVGQKASNVVMVDDDEFDRLMAEVGM